MKWRLSRPGKWSRSGAAVFIMAGALLLGGGAAAYLGGVVKSITANNVDLQKGLVGWWQMNGNAMDSTPYSNNATVHSATLVADRKGKANAAYNFSGSGQYLESPDSASLRVGSSANLSFAAWINPGTITGCAGPNCIILNKENSYEWAIDNNAHICFALRNTAPAWNWTCASTATAPSGQWSHVVLTYDGSNVRVYINGSIQSTIAASGNIDNTNFRNALRIGARNAPGTANAYFPGVIDDVRIYNRTLSGTEASALYNQYDPGIKADQGENGLIGWWKLDGNGNDSSPYANNATLTNVTLTTDRKNTANSAYNFNGTSSQIGMTVPQVANLISYSFSVWFDPTANSNTVADGIMGNTNNPRLTWGDSVTAGKPSTVQLLIGHQGGGNGCNITTGGVSQNTWHQAVVTVSAGASCRLYIDGSLIGSSSNNTPWTLPQSGWWLGNRDGTTRFPGSIDDARIYNRVLSSTDVTNLYKSYNSQLALGGSPGSSVQLGKGLVGDWPLNGNAKDMTPYGDNGTVSGASLTSDRKGRTNSAYSVSGTSGSVTVSASNMPTTAITVSAWVNLASLPAAWTRFINNGWAVEGSWLLFVDSSGRPEFGVFHTAEHDARCGAMSTGVWHHLVGTYDGSTVSTYVDGNLCATNAISGAVFNHSGTATILSSVGSASPYSLDDARIWSRPLNAAEVSALYNEYR